MSRRSNPVPTYRLHKQSGLAIVTIRTAEGSRRDVLLGKYDTPESRADYARIVAELQAGSTLSMMARGAMVNELVERFRLFAEKHYRRSDGTLTREFAEFGYALRPVRELYGHTRAEEFGPLALQAVRQKMIEIGWCRARINKQVGRIRRAFRWAASQKMIPAATFLSLSTLGGLQLGRTQAKESTPVLPADPAAVEAVLPFLVPTLRAMVELQRWTGCRPGEVRMITAGAIDQTSGTWLYRPAGHKMAHAGRDRVIPIGPRARAVLETYLRHGVPDARPVEVSGLDISPAPPRIVQSMIEDAKTFGSRGTPRYGGGMRRRRWLHGAGRGFRGIGLWDITRGCLVRVLGGRRGNSSWAGTAWRPRLSRRSHADGGTIRAGSLHPRTAALPNGLPLRFRSTCSAGQYGGRR